MKYKSLSNDNLISKAKQTISTEREATAEVILIFEEIYSRRLYLTFGFPSLFEMATKFFGYCPASAMRRINAMRLVRDVPDVFEKIESGELSLSVVNELQTYFQREAKAERAYSPSAKEELIDFSLGKSRREVEREIANRNPEIAKPETIHAISNDRLRMNISISKVLLEKINQLRDLRSHANPKMTIEELLTELVELGLDKHDPARKIERSEKRKASKFQNISRAAKTSDKSKVDETSRAAKESRASIDQESTNTAKPNLEKAALETLPSAEVKRTRYIPVRERPPKEPCCFVDSGSGRRCNSTRFLQLDHIEPFAEGGKNAKENLRWLCGEHNRARTAAH